MNYRDPLRRDFFHYRVCLVSGRLLKIGEANLDLLFRADLHYRDDAAATEL